MSHAASSERHHAGHGFFLAAHKNGIAGAVAGAMTAFLTCPLDVLRTRQQVQLKLKGGETPKYQGLRQSLSLVLREEGALGLFKGLGPQLFGLVPSWALYFTVYDHLKPVLTHYSGDRLSQPVIHMISAISAGAITNLGTTPFFTVKTRLQTQQININNNTSNHPPYKGTFDAFRTIARQEGLPVLWSGLLPSMIGLIHVAIQFPLYEKFKSMAQTKGPDEQLGLKDLFLCAAGSKVFASAAAYPHEVIRSRLQGQGRGSAAKYSGVVDVVKTTIRQEGFFALYNGLGITLVRTVPASMITLSVYEYTMRFIKWYTT